MSIKQQLGERMLSLCRHFPFISVLFFWVSVNLFHFLSYGFEISCKGDECTGNGKTKQWRRQFPSPSHFPGPQHWSPDHNSLFPGWSLLAEFLLPGLWAAWLRRPQRASQTRGRGHLNDPWSITQVGEGQLEGKTCLETHARGQGSISSAHTGQGLDSWLDRCLLLTAACKSRSLAKCCFHRLARAVISVK